MANSIELSKKYIPLLDAKYASESKTAFLNIDNALTKAGATANTILIPKMAFDGLADHNRNADLHAGDVTFEYETHTFTRHRSKTFQIDRQDNTENLDVPMAMFAKEFVANAVSKESDAYKVNKLVAKAGTVVAADLVEDTIEAAINAGIVALDEASVPESNRVLFISPLNYNLLKAAQPHMFSVQSEVGIIDKNFMTFDGMRIVKMPTDIFKSAFTFSATDGYAPAVGAKTLNFILMNKDAAFGIVKQASLRVFTPDQNLNRDAYKIDYILYEELFVMDNRVNGIYVSKRST